MLQEKINQIHKEIQSGVRPNTCDLCKISLVITPTIRIHFFEDGKTGVTHELCEKIVTETASITKQDSFQLLKKAMFPIIKEFLA